MNLYSYAANIITESQELAAHGTAIASTQEEAEQQVAGKIKDQLLKKVIEIQLYMKPLPDSKMIIYLRDKGYQITTPED